MEILRGIIILKEIIQRKKSKLVIVAILMAFLFMVASSAIQPKKEKNSLNSEIIESDEFTAISGTWRITKYLGEYVEFHGAEPTTEDEISEKDESIRKIKEKYLEKELNITSENILTFGPPSELGYQALSWDDLFFIYRQPPDIWDGVSPPFLCISLELKNYDDTLNIILDTNGIATFEVKGHFFRLEKIDKD